MVYVQRVHWRCGRLRRVGGVAVVMATLAGCSSAVEDLVKVRVSGNEASAIASLRTIVSAQTVTALDCNGRYTPSLTALGATGNLSPDLGASDTIEKAGYIITMTPSDDGGPAAEGLTPACQGTVAAFTATAVPIEPGKTGERFFVVDQQGNVKQATSASFEDATPLQ